MVNTHTPKNRPRQAVTGLFDRLLRSGRGLVHGPMMVPIFLLGILIIGLAISPGVWVFHLITALGEGHSALYQTLAVGFGISAGFVTFGFALLFIVPLVNLPVLFFLKPARGAYHSARFLPWYLHNSLAYIVRYMFLDFITPSPLNHMYFMMMGMKIGKNAQVNTSNISDPGLIILEEDVTIGGSVTILGHYGQGGFLVLKPTIIRKGATIGLLASVLGGVEIGEGAKILPHSVVMPKSRVPAGETWGGVPAKKIERNSQNPENAPPSV